jgi:hypothetical protein
MGYSKLAECNDTAEPPVTRRSLLYEDSAFVASRLGQERVDEVQDPFHRFCVKRKRS